MSELLVADYEIRQLYARFIDAAWRQDGEAYAKLFAENGEWKLAAMHMHGREEIAATFTKLLGYTSKVQIILGFPILDVRGEEATARINCTEITKMPDGSSSMAQGVYFDRFVKENGRWVFRWRHFSLAYRGPIDFSEALVDSPNYGAFPGMPEWDETTQTRLKQD